MSAIPVRWLTVFLDFTFCLVRWHGEGFVPGPVRLELRRAGLDDRVTDDSVAAAP